MEIQRAWNRSIKENILSWPFDFEIFSKPSVALGGNSRLAKTAHLDKIKSISHCNAANSERCRTLIHAEKEETAETIGKFIDVLESGIRTVEVR